MELKYIPLEKLVVKRTVNRIKYIVALCKDKNVLDLGCLDETAIEEKSNTKYWLHSEISNVSNNLLGLDNSSKIPPEGLKVNNSIIKYFDIMNITSEQTEDYDNIVAGELIEHLPNVLGFFKLIKKTSNNKTLICSTPNSTSITQSFLSVFKRESNHKDHLQIYSFKTLNTLCLMANFQDWDIIPYHVKFTEMIANSSGIKKMAILLIEKTINVIEYLFPLTSGGLILHVKKI